MVHRRAINSMRTEQDGSRLVRSAVAEVEVHFGHRRMFVCPNVSFSKTPPITNANTYLVDGKVDNVTIPSNIAPGGYLIRHECIDLQFANQGAGKAEFYPGCAQIRIGGSQTGKPDDNELVSLPGAYHDNDPGLYNSKGFNLDAYVFSGPAIAAFISGSTGFDTITNRTLGGLDVNAPAYSPFGIFISLFIYAMACQILGF